MTVSAVTSMPGSIGFRGITSRLITPDRSSRILGHRYEENYLNQAIGQCVLSWRGTTPAKLAIFASEPEMDAISRCGLCGTLASAFGGSLELHELSEPSVRALVKSHLENSPDPLMVVLLGTEKKPKAWPLPDFGKVVTLDHTVPGKTAPASPLPGLGRSGDWLRLDRKGGMSCLDASILATTWQEPGTRGHGSFEYSWGIWAATIAANPGPEALSTTTSRSLKIETVKIASGGAGLLALVGEARSRVSRFFADFHQKPDGILAMSFPTPESGRWLFQAAGFFPGDIPNIVFTEDLHGWGPAFTFLRFVADFPAGSRLVLMRDLSSVDLVEIA